MDEQVKEAGLELYPLFVNWIAIAAIISGLALAGWWVVGLYGVHTRKEEKEFPEVELPAHLHEVVSGIPPFLIVFYALTGVILIAYVLYIWLGGLNY